MSCCDRGAIGCGSELVKRERLGIDEGRIIKGLLLLAMEQTRTEKGCISQQVAIPSLMSIIDNIRYLCYLCVY